MPQSLNFLYFMKGVFMTSDISSLLHEMQSYGLRVNSNRLVHGKIVRCPTNNKPHRKNGFVLVFFNPTFTYALYGDYQQGGEIIKWSSKHRLSSAEKQQVQEHIAEYHQQREREIQQNLRNIRSIYSKFQLLSSGQSDTVEADCTEQSISIRAEQSAQYCDLQHAYLHKKSIADIVQHKLAYPIRIDNYGNLVIPMLSVNAELMGYQTIARDNSKRFAKGSLVKGSFYPIMTSTIVDIGSCSSIFIGEGFATMASCYLSMCEHGQDHVGNTHARNAYIVAYGVHMIEPVLLELAKTFLAKNPAINIILVADNDAVGADNSGKADTCNIGVDICQAIKSRYQNKYKISVFIPQLVGGVA